MSGERRPSEITLERYAFIAAQVVLHEDRPRAEVLGMFALTEPAWDVMVADWTRRMVDEIRTRSGSSAPVAERYPIASGYATAYARAVREAQKELDRGEDEATVRIAPGTPRDEPFSVLGASNRAAAEGRAARGKTA